MEMLIQSAKFEWNFQQISVIWHTGRVVTIKTNKKGHVERQSTDLNAIKVDNNSIWGQKKMTALLDSSQSVSIMPRIFVVFKF